MLSLRKHLDVASNKGFVYDRYEIWAKCILNNLSPQQSSLFILFHYNFFGTKWNHFLHANNVDVRLFIALLENNLIDFEDG